MDSIFFVIVIALGALAVWQGRPAKWRNPYFETGRYVDSRFEWARGLKGVLPKPMVKHLDTGWEYLERSKYLWREGYREDALRLALCAKKEVDAAEAIYNENPIVDDGKVWFKSDKKD